MLDSRFVILGAALCFAGAATYLVDTIHGSVRPNRVSMGLLALFPMIAFSAQIYEGVGAEAVLTLTAGIGPLAAFVASLFVPGAHWRLVRHDWWCGALSIAAIVVWGFTRGAMWAIVFALLADLLAAVPILLKAYRVPRSESLGGFVLSTMGAIVTLLTITQWRPANYLFPIYLVAFGISVVALMTLSPNRANDATGPAIRASNGEVAVGPARRRVMPSLAMSTKPTQPRSRKLIPLSRSISRAALKGLSCERHRLAGAGIPQTCSTRREAHTAARQGIRRPVAMQSMMEHQQTIR